MLVINNFLPDEVLKVVQLTVDSWKSSKRLGWTNMSWDPNLQLKSALVFVTPFDELNSTFEKLFKEKDPSLDNVFINTQFCVWGPGSTIPFHDDHHVKFAATVYLNQAWRIEDGGLFIWVNRHTGKLEVIPPTYNMCVINNEQESHHVTNTSFAPDQMRITLQIWAFHKNSPEQDNNESFSYR